MSIMGICYSTFNYITTYRNLGVLFFLSELMLQLQLLHSGIFKSLNILPLLSTFKIFFLFKLYSDVSTYPFLSFSLPDILWVP